MLDLALPGELMSSLVELLQFTDAVFFFLCVASGRQHSGHRREITTAPPLAFPCASLFPSRPVFFQFFSPIHCSKIREKWGLTTENKLLKLNFLPDYKLLSVIFGDIIKQTLQLKCVNEACKICDHFIAMSLRVCVLYASIELKWSTRLVHEETCFHFRHFSE